MNTDEDSDQNLDLKTIAGFVKMSVPKSYVLAHIITCTSV